MILFLCPYVKKMDTSMFIMNKNNTVKGLVKYDLEISKLKHDLDISHKLSRGSTLLFLVLLTIHLSNYTFIVTF